MKLLKKLNLFIVLLLLSTQLYSQDDCDEPYMEIGMGLAGGSYWTSQHIFKDYALYKSTWITSYEGGPWDTGEIHLLEVDSKGYALKLPQNIDGKEIIVKSAFTARGYMPLGNYSLLYDGEATISFNGALQLIEKVSEGHIKFKVINEGSGWIEINSTPLGKHITNIQSIPEKYIDNYTDEPFHPEFLEKIKPYSVLRMMDLMKANNWDTSWAQYTDNLDEFLRDREWNERILPDYYTQTSTKGMAYEYLISIANHTHKDIWLTIPHNVSNDFVKEMAILFKQTLNSDLKVYLEYSNEVWNWQFQQSKWVLEHYEKGRFPNAENHTQAAGTRAKEIYNVWMAEYNDTKDKVVRIIGGQAANPSVGKHWMAVMKDSEWDALAITHYFGIENPWGEDDPKFLFRDRLNAFDASASTTDIVNLAKENYEYLKNKHGGESYWRGNVKNATSHNKPTVTYEGNGHIVHSNNIADSAFLDIVIEASRSPEMAVFYGEVINDMRDWGMSLLMPFVLVGEPSIWGDWGHYKSTFDTKTPPKVQILLDNISPCQLKIQEPEEEIKEIIIGGVFPNPFESSITISFDKGEVGQKKEVKIFDISGQLIRVMEKAVQESGAVVLEDLRLSSGVYLLMVDDIIFYKIIKR